MNPWILVFIAVVLIIAVLLLAFLSKQPVRSRLNKEFYQTEWLKITNAFQANEPMTYGITIINADKLVGKALADLKIPGKNMGERMKNSGQRFSNLDGFWAAHKLRNRIAHETGVALNDRQVKQALAQFRQALKDVGAI